MNKISEIKVSDNTRKIPKEKITSSQKAYEILLNSWAREGAKAERHSL